MKSPEEILEQAYRFLKQEREMFGEWARPDAGTANGPEPTSAPEESRPAEEPGSPGSEPVLQQRLQNCSTLDELRALCDSSEELKTDLEGTRLVFGVGNPQADLMLIGEAPGFYEDQQGEPFVGKAGQLLNKILNAIRLERQDVYIANILKHRPPDNRDPKPEERENSLPFLLRQIDLIQPKLILCLGRVSATTLLGREASLSSLRGTLHPFHGTELMATYHPAALLRNPQWKRPVWEDVQKLRERYDQLNCQP
ncbi:MAG: uracil-DNA glycosylase [Balneolaceae bacterium]